MVILLSGTINAGKTSCANRLVEAYMPQAVVVEIDQFFNCFPGKEPATVAKQCLRAGIASIIHFVRQGYAVVVPYPLWRDDLQLVLEALAPLGVDTHYITLTPALTAVLDSRSKRRNKGWERQVVRWHRELGVLQPAAGVTLDTTDLTVDETAQAVLRVVERGIALTQVSDLVGVQEQQRA